MKKEKEKCYDQNKKKIFLTKRKRKMLWKKKKKNNFTVHANPCCPINVWTDFKDKMVFVTLSHAQKDFSF